MLIIAAIILTLSTPNNSNKNYNSSTQKRKKSKNSSNKKKKMNKLRKIATKIKSLFIIKMKITTKMIKIKKILQQRS